MAARSQDHTLEFLLDFDGRVHFYERGYWVKFEIRRVSGTPERPHGLSYSFTLHGPDNRRLIGFDNAHAAKAPGGRRKARAKAHDHWHRTEHDPGRPYEFRDAVTLIGDFFDEVERVLTEKGVPFQAVASKEGDEP
jgi:hypothetical protein